MPGPAVAEPEVVVEPIVDAAAEMRAGFASDEEPTSPAPGAVPSPDPTPAPVPPEPIVAPPAASPTSFTSQQITDILAGVAKINELEASFGKKHDQTAGQIGRLQQMVNERTTTTPSGRPVPISEDDFKELKAEFPELSTPLLKELIPALQKLVVPVSSFDEERARAIAQEASITAREQAAHDALTDAREDWEEIVGIKDSDTPFRQWLALQPLDYQQTVRTTFRAGVMVKAIEKFEEFQRATAPPEPPATGKTPAVRHARLNAAVAPKGQPAPVGGTPKTAAEEMRDGYNSD